MDPPLSIDVSSEQFHAPGAAATADPLLMVSLEQPPQEQLQQQLGKAPHHPPPDSAVVAGPGMEDPVGAIGFELETVPQHPPRPTAIDLPPKTTWSPTVSNGESSATSPGVEELQNSILPLSLPLPPSLIFGASGTSSSGSTLPHTATSASAAGTMPHPTSPLRNLAMDTVIPDPFAPSSPSRHGSLSSGSARRAHGGSRPSHSGASAENGTAATIAAATAILAAGSFPRHQQQRDSLMLDPANGMATVGGSGSGGGGQAKLSVRSRSRSPARSLTLSEVPATPPIISRAESTVANNSGAPGSQDGSKPPSAGSSRSPSLFSSLFAMGVGGMSPPRLSTASINGRAVLGQSGDIEHGSIGGDASPRHRSESAQVQRTVQTASLMVRSRSKSMHPRSATSSILEMGSGTVANIVTSTLSTSSARPGSLPTSNGSSRVPSSNNIATSSPPVGSPRSGPQGWISLMKQAVVPNREEQDAPQGTGTADIDLRHEKPTVPQQQQPQQQGSGVIASPPTLSLDTGISAPVAGQPHNDPPLLVISIDSVDEEGNVGNSRVLSPAIFISGTTPRAGGSKVQYDEDKDEERDRFDQQQQASGGSGDRVASTDEDEEDAASSGRDRYYDPDDEDDSGPVLVPLKSAMGSGNTRDAGATSSAVSIKIDAMRKASSRSRTALPGGGGGGVPAADHASLDPLASARNLFLSPGDEYGVHPGARGGGGAGGGGAGTAQTGDASGADADYLQYLLTRKFSSSNFISRIESKDVVWETGAAPEARFIDRFLVGQVIGRGSFGKVKDGMCTDTLQPVAIKIMSHKRLRKIQFGIEAVSKEIQTLRRLQGHPNVVRLLDVFAKAEDRDGNESILPWSIHLEQVLRYKTLKRYMVFEFCHGNLQSLLDSADEGHLPLHQTQDYMIQLMDGLEYLHARHIVHRDIKPANLLLTLDGVLKISDFGVAETLTPYDGTDACQNFAGTQQYMSPEVAMGESNPSGEKVDVWAAGVTLFNMAFGTFPFDFSGAAMGMFEQIHLAEIDMPDDPHPELASLVLGMLDKSPVARFNVSQVRAHEFLRTHPSLLAEGTYVPMPALTAEAAVVHAAVTLGRGKGTLARPVSPRTLSRSQGAAGGGNGGGNGLGGPGSPSSLVPPLLSHLTISRSAGRSMAPPPPPPMPMKVKSEDDDDDGCENKLPYSLFPVVEPMFPELMTLAPLPRAAKKSDSQRRTSEASQASWRRSSKSSIPGETGAARFLMKRFGRSSAKVAQK